MNLTFPLDVPTPKVTNEMTALTHKEIVWNLKSFPLVLDNPSTFSVIT